MLHLSRPAILALALLVIACGSGGGGSDSGTSDSTGRRVLVRWRAGPSVDGYVIHWGISSRVYSDEIDVGVPESDADGIVSYLLEEPGPAGTIYFCLSSYDAEGRMSPFSNELSAAVP